MTGSAVQLDQGSGECAGSDRRCLPLALGAALMTATSPPCDPDVVRSTSGPLDVTAGFEAEVVRQGRCRPREVHGGCHRSGAAVEPAALILRGKAL